MSDADFMRAKFHGMLENTAIAVLKIVEAIRIFGEIQGTLLELSLTSNQESAEIISLLEKIRTALDYDMAAISRLTQSLAEKWDTF